MPNWCLNRVRISGDDEQVEELVNFVQGTEVNFCFNKIIPMPVALSDTRSPMKIVETKEEAEEENKRMNKIFADIEGGTERRGAITKEEQSQLIRDYGYDNWYDWCVENWGTKWGLGDNADMEWDGGNVVTYEFDTAWGPPEPVYHVLAEKFPDLHISWFYDEPGMECSGYLNNKRYTLSA